MLSRFYLRKLYTLCLVEDVKGEPHTWSVNVTYQGVEPASGCRLFEDIEFYYEVDLDTRDVSIIPKYDDEEEYSSDASLANVVAGWQY